MATDLDIRQLVLTNLPHEILELISNCLDFHDLISFSTTCRSIHSIAFPLLWRNVQIGIKSPFETLQVCALEQDTVHQFSMEQWPRTRLLTEGILTGGSAVGMERIDHFFRALLNGDISKRALESIRSVTYYCEYRLSEFDLQYHGFGTAGTALSIQTVYECTLSFLKNNFLNQRVLPNLTSFGIFFPNSCLDHDFPGFHPNQVFEVLRDWTTPLQLHLSGLTFDELLGIDVLPSWSLDYLSITERPTRVNYKAQSSESLLACSKNLKVLRFIGAHLFTEETLEGEADYNTSIKNFIVQLPHLNALVLNNTWKGPRLNSNYFNVLNMSYLYLDVYLDSDNEYLRSAGFPGILWEELCTCEFPNLHTLSLKVRHDNMVYDKSTSPFHNLSAVYLESAAEDNSLNGLDVVLFEGNKKLKSAVVPFLSEEGLMALQECTLLETLCVTEKPLSTPSLLGRQSSPLDNLLIEKLSSASCWPCLANVFIKSQPKLMKQRHIDDIVTARPGLARFVMGGKQNSTSSLRRTPFASSGPILEPGLPFLSTGQVGRSPHPPPVATSPGALRDPFYEPEDHQYTRTRARPRMRDNISFQNWESASITSPTEFTFGNVVLSDRDLSHLMELNISKHRASLSRV